MEYKEPYNGVKIPMLGYGVYQIPEYEAAKSAVLTALKTGYRLIDTAQGYMNEKAVGDAIKDSGIPREEIFITTKLWLQDFCEVPLKNIKQIPSYPKIRNYASLVFGQ